MYRGQKKKNHISFVDRLKRCKSRGKALNVQISGLIHNSEKGGKLAERELQRYYHH